MFVKISIYFLVQLLLSFLGLLMVETVDSMVQTLVLFLVEVGEPLVIISLLLLFTIFYCRTVTYILFMVCLCLLSLHFLEVGLVLGGLV